MRNGKKRECTSGPGGGGAKIGRPTRSSSLQAGLARKRKGCTGVRRNGSALNSATCKISRNSMILCDGRFTYISTC